MRAHPMTDDMEFIGNVKTLAANGTLRKLFDMIEEDETRRWKSQPDKDLREECWLTLQGITLLRAKIESLTNDEKVRQWFNQRIARRM